MEETLFFLSRRLGESLSPSFIDTRGIKLYPRVSLDGDQRDSRDPRVFCKDDPTALFNPGMRRLECRYSPSGLFRQRRRLEAGPDIRWIEVSRFFRPLLLPPPCTHSFPPLKDDILSAMGDA